MEPNLWRAGAMNAAAANALAQLQGLTDEEQKQITQIIAGPGGKTRNALWMIVVIAFAFVLGFPFTDTEARSGNGDRAPVTPNQGDGP